MNWWSLSHWDGAGLLESLKCKKTLTILKMSQTVTLIDHQVIKIPLHDCKLTTTSLSNKTDKWWLQIRYRDPQPGWKILLKGHVLVVYKSGFIREAKLDQKYI